jgi:hypothetical protein
MNNLTTLRDHLFRQLERIEDADEVRLQIEMSKAAVLVQISDALLRTAELENQFIIANKSEGTGFISAPKKQVELPPATEFNADNVRVRKPAIFKHDEDSEFEPENSDPDED